MKAALECRESSKGRNGVSREKKKAYRKKDATRGEERRWKSRREEWPTFRAGCEGRGKIRVESRRLWREGDDTKLDETSAEKNKV
ncbi:hypothetical protein N7501_006614 [Penicillium viridicatum]|nr:hypothetical protein N7501_006614 [Penicillium viridicatum]